MELLNNLLRYLVGIIFPGLICLFWLSLFFIGLDISFEHYFFGEITPLEIGSEEISGKAGEGRSKSTITDVLDSSLGLLIIIAFALVIGQIFRIKTLDRLEIKATNFESWNLITRLEFSGIKKWFSLFTKTIFIIKPGSQLPEKIVISKTERLLRVEKAFNLLLAKSRSSEVTDDQIHKELLILYKEVQPLEVFPYPLSSRIRRKLGLPNAYDEFFLLLENKMNNSTFFNHCTSLIFHSDSSLKEELLRAEDLVRLLAGIYYNLRLAFYCSFTIFVIQGINYFSTILSFSLSTCLIACGFVVLSLIGQAEILTRIRRRRKKEVNFAYDGYYFIMTASKPSKKSVHGATG